MEYFPTDLGQYEILKIVSKFQIIIVDTRHIPVVQEKEMKIRFIFYLEIPVWISASR